MHYDGSDSTTYTDNEVNSSLDDYLRVYQYRYSTIDGKDIAILIISTMTLNGKLYAYTDYVFASQKSGTVVTNYYLGNIKSIFSTNIKNNNESRFFASKNCQRGLFL